MNLLLCKGFQLSYGFTSDIMPSQIPNAPRQDGGVAPQQLGWAFGDSGSFTGGTVGGVTDVTAVSQDEIPCQSIFVPEDDQPIYGSYYVSIF